MFKYDTRYTAIPEGSTNHNDPGYWQEGNYATVTDILRNSTTLEVGLTLHNQKQ